MNDTIVVMEAGGRFPSWVDEQNGPESNVWIVAQSSDESAEAFAKRVVAHLETSPARTALYVCRAESGTDAVLRKALARTLIDRVHSRGGTNVMLVADGGYALRSELTALCDQLISEIDERDVQVTLRFRALPSVPPPAPGATLSPAP
jgi:hypothetical protein